MCLTKKNRVVDIRPAMYHHVGGERCIKRGQVSAAVSAKSQRRLPLFVAISTPAFAAIRTRTMSIAHLAIATLRGVAPSLFAIFDTSLSHDQRAHDVWPFSLPVHILGDAL